MTRQERFALLGHPVAHSVSPAIHAAAYAALGLAHRYELIDCADEAAFRRAVSGLSKGELAGANVTIPYKLLALDVADDASPIARQARAANVLSVRDGRVYADNSDVLGLEDELARWAPDARDAIVIGSGGTALACVCALERRGLAKVAVTARRFAFGTPPDAWPNFEAFLALGAELVLWPGAEPAAFRDRVRAADLVIQATSAGMRGGAPGEDVSRVMPWEAFRTSALAYDVVYTPGVTPFLDAARRRGLRTAGGLGMLVAQAAHAIRIWLGREPPRDVLLAAAESALAREGGT